MKNDMYELPDTLYDFAQIPNFHTVIEDLANLAEAEDWNYHNQTDPQTDYPILENYLRNTYIRLARAFEERSKGRGAPYNEPPSP